MLEFVYFVAVAALEIQGIEVFYQGPINLHICTLDGGVATFLLLPLPLTIPFCTPLFPFLLLALSLNLLFVTFFAIYLVPPCKAFIVWAIAIPHLPSPSFPTLKEIV